MPAVCRPAVEAMCAALPDRHWAADAPDKRPSCSRTGATGPTPRCASACAARAAGLEALGVKRGEHVAVWMFNGPDALETFFAINYLGAVFVPFNTAYRGRILEHVIATPARG